MSDSEKAATCPNHPDAPASPCATCGAKYCEKCTYGSIDGMVCADCWSKQRARRVRRGVALGVGAAILAGGAVTGIALTFSHDSQEGPGAAKAPAPPDAQTDLADSYREHLRKEPCNAEVEVDLIKYLTEKERWKDVLADGYRLLGECGTENYGKLRWKIGYAHQQLDQWLADALLDGQLVAEHPDDSDYWWWRGEAYQHASLPDLAMADYRQSIALSENADAAGFATGRIGDAAEAAKRPCEGARAWRLFRRGFGGDVAQSGLDEESRLSITGHCDQEDGAGQAALALDETGRGKGKVKVGAQGGSFMIDPFCGTTMLSASFAAKAGVTSASVQRGEAMFGGIRVQGAPALAPDVTAGAAHAPNIDVLIVPDDQLPGGVDGVLGLSFFWRFDIDREDRSIKLAAPAP